MKKSSRSLSPKKKQETPLLKEVSVAEDFKIHRLNLEAFQQPKRTLEQEAQLKAAFLT